MLDLANASVVFIDVQGKLAELMHDRQNLFDNLRRFVGGARALGLPVCVTEQNPAKLGATRDEFAELLAGLPVYTKMSFSCAGCVPFMEALRQSDRRQVLLAGIETHVCVYQTAADLLAAGYQVYTVSDAVSSRHPANRQAGLDRMAALGAVITTTEMALMELMRTAEHPAFRDVLKQIR